jgi:hypothetical protein
MAGRKAEVKVKAKVSMEPVVIPRNPVGPDGKPRTEDEMRPYSLGKQVMQTIEVDYKGAVELWGKEKADELFKKGVKDAE